VIAHSAHTFRKNKTSAKKLGLPDGILFHRQKGILRINGMKKLVSLVSLAIVFGIGILVPTIFIAKVYWSIAVLSTTDKRAANESSICGTKGITELISCGDA
jgi:hypothetical protein